MLIGCLQLRIIIPESQSLKAKRFVLKSLVDKIRDRFNVSCSEVDGKDLWQASTVAVVMVGDDKQHINRCLDKIADLVRGIRRVEVLDQHLEFM